MAQKSLIFSLIKISTNFMKKFKHVAKNFIPRKSFIGWDLQVAENCHENENQKIDTKENSVHGRGEHQPLSVGHAIRARVLAADNGLLVAFVVDVVRHFLSNWVENGPLHLRRVRHNKIDKLVHILIRRLRTEGSGPSTSSLPNHPASVCLTNQGNGIARLCLEILITMTDSIMVNAAITKHQP